MDEEKPLSQYVAKRGKCRDGLGAKSRNGCRKARNRGILDCGARAAETQKKESATVTRACAAALIMSAWTPLLHRSRGARSAVFPTLWESDNKHEEEGPRASLPGEGRHIRTLESHKLAKRLAVTGLFILSFVSCRTPMEVSQVRAVRPFDHSLPKQSATR
jgi:hypothetical protein